MARRWLTGAILAASVAAVAYWRRALTLDGSMAAAVVGSIVFARGGASAAGALLAFFASSSALSRVGEARKRSLPLAQAKGARRDAWQVLANGGVATLALVSGRPRAFVGALAAASADTWATELGLLARRSPRLITTFRRVPPGTSGAITPEGLAASLGGALAVGAAYAALGGGPAVIATSVLAGVSAALADSLLGATIQAAYRCGRCATDTEEPTHLRCGTRTQLIHGWSWMNNDAVNALATVTGALVASKTPNAAEHVRGGR